MCECVLSCEPSIHHLSFMDLLYAQQRRVDVSCRFAHLTTTADNARRMCSKLHKMKFLSRFLVVELAHDRASVDMNTRRAAAASMQTGVSAQSLSHQKPPAETVPLLSLPRAATTEPRVMSDIDPAVMSAQRNSDGGSQSARRAAADSVTQAGRMTSPWKMNNAAGSAGQY